MSCVPDDIHTSGTGPDPRRDEEHGFGIGDNTKEEVEATRMSKDSSMGTASFERVHLRDPKKGFF